MTQIKHPIGIAAPCRQLGFRTEAFAKYEPDASGYEYAEKCEIGNSVVVFAYVSTPQLQRSLIQQCVRLPVYV